MRKTNTTLLTPVSNLSMTDRVENSLRQYFEDNKFKPGDPLPNEMDMATQLNVSRNVVREALSRLRMLGMVEARPRRGMVMAQPDLLAGIEKVLNPMILSKDNLKDIFEMRLILEMGVSEFLFARKTKAQVQELEEIVARQQNNEALTIEEEVAFHGKLYEMAGNDTFARFQNLLIPVFNHVFSERFRMHVEIPDPVTHHDLIEVLKNGTADDFRKAMYKHLSPYYHTSNISQVQAK
ncbi:FadR/GntR family transcriptional regulator [Dyadobacter sp. CY323]|uniref:FadR/GntR family transcriptional regulator n=1 Tax=Dyadobacter sp. CY323 TaxID=2907302 RepID=UPI001F32E280|nr:GntR family transcriptional regulator [Dyadobacter sp. CY323]MCE6988576.1 GntR family transcriptional regulator [Dyadobacter sp. CY323]